MNNKVVIFLTFTAGVAVGAAGTWKYFKDMYEQIAQEEIDSVKEVFARRGVEEAKTASVNTTDNDILQSSNNKPNITEYAARLQKEGYTNYSEIQSEEKEEEMIEGPYVIAPEAFMEYEDYDHVSLTYYADGVLTDENDEVIEDVEETVGEDSLSHFGEYEKDSVYVRNDTRGIDYEILLDERLYSDVVKQMPHQTEV